MYQIRIILKFIKHFITAKHTGGHGVHSPFVFQFTHYVLEEKNSFYIFSSIEKLRKQLKNDNRIIDVTDFGTGKNRQNKILTIASKSAKTAKLGQLLFRIAHYSKATQVLELGTSLGISTLYLACQNSTSKCISMEGCAATAKIAKENFDKLEVKNIEIIVGNIDDNLNSTLEKFENIDVLFIDANHKYEALTAYFEKCLPKMSKNSILIIDDIYWSVGMENAWSFIKNHTQVKSTIDLFQLGIVFFNDDLKKKHYKMRY